ncbi:tetratricopeptide repeat protein [Roseibium litorale]|uniref:Tetratricopeptide repeat protein n=1 Tax=Roseibium litorale TaxID=2803841 RepID=A0ABR9CQ10_9HYPH|nr:tetratricopeptide repeat protein [Roseibium litorale]MBD8892753.1 tetratricopeptide repeat protein [Roseibium litorale]
MSDIFREVDEDIRQEKYRRLWDRLGPWVIALAVLIVVGTGGYRGWIYWQKGKSEAAGDVFFEAVRLSETGDSAAAQAKLNELSQSTGGYPVLARMREASELALNGKKAEAIEAFDAISKDGSVENALQDIARLRAGFLAVDTEDYAAVSARLEPMSGTGEPFRAGAREILALAAWKAGDTEAARRWIGMIEEDTGTPSDISRRVTILSDVITADNGSAGETADSSEGTKQ